MGSLKDHIRIIMGSKCNHISVLKGSYQELNKIKLGQNLSCSGIDKKWLSHITKNLLAPYPVS